MFLRLLRDASATGGTGGDATAPGNAPGGGGVGTTPANAGGGSQAASAAGDGGGNLSNSNPVGDIDYKAEHEKLTAELTTVKQQLEEKTKGLDSAGNKIQALKHLEKTLKENPRAVIENLAKDHNFKVVFADEGAGPKEITVPDNLGEMKRDDFLKAMNDVISNAKLQGAAEAEKRIMEKITPELDLSYQEAMRRRHDDWDTGEEGRQNLRAQRLANEIRMPELLHLAWKGSNLPAILEAHKAKVIADHEDIQRKKVEASLSPGGQMSRTAAATGKVELKDLVVASGEKKAVL